MYSPVLQTVFAYLIGSIPCGLLIGRLNGIDIRKHGSGNIGATNVRRILGRKWGAVCFVFDFLKGAGPVTVSMLFMKQAPELLPDWTAAAVAAAAVCGHIWPLYLHFQGGKGVATTIGAILPIAPLAVLIAVFGWWLVFKFSRYVSLASLTAALLLPLSAWLLNRLQLVQAAGAEIWLLILLAALIWLRHRSNIQKLLNGTENRFAKKKRAD